MQRLDHVEIARLENAQPQRAAGKQHGVQREQRNGCVGRAAHEPASITYRLREPLQQLLVNPAESTVGHDQHMIPGAERCAERARPAGRDPSRPAARSPSPATEPATSQVTFGPWYSQTRSARSSDFASASRCVPSFIVFERGSSTAIRRELPMRRRRAVDRDVDRGRMMCKVVVDRDAADDAANFHAAAHAAKLLQRGDRRSRSHTPACARRAWRPARSPRCAGRASAIARRRRARLPSMIANVE